MTQQQSMLHHDGRWQDTTSDHIFNNLNPTKKQKSVITQTAVAGHINQAIVPVKRAWMKRP